MSWKGYLLTSLLMSSLFLFGSTNPTLPSINEIMSMEDQKITGIIRLTQEQKMALVKWLVAHGCYEEEGRGEIIYAVKISLNVYGGKILQLSDNSTWEVAPDDQALASTWLTSIPVKISPSSNPTYPYLLTNLNNNKSIKVKKGVI